MKNQLQVLFASLLICSTYCLKAQFSADSLVPKTVLYEEFMQASCGPCFEAAPNLDSVMKNNQKTCIPIRYHVSWPDVDYMYLATWSPYNDVRVQTYYGINSVPNAEMDGTSSDPASINSWDIWDEAINESPFRITITSFTFDEGTDTYNVQANIKSFQTFSRKLAVQAILTVDTIEYAENQSTEVPSSVFAPPIGSGSYPDSYYAFVTKFPQVVEQMMTGSSGKLYSFAAEQTQTLNMSWKKNHPWGDDNKTWRYDSMFPGEHIVVFVQDNDSANYVYQAASEPVGYVLGVNNINNGFTFNLYPNPTSGDVNMVFNLTQTQNVTINLYNVLGENLYTRQMGKLNSGQHNIIIPNEGFNPGVYFVRVATDNETTTIKLVIQ
jgi:hypothetical protein